MSSIPTTCKAAVLVEYGTPLEIREIEIPAIGPGAVLVKVLMAGICGTDVHQQKGELTIKSPLPNLPGHETIGRIVTLGDGRVKDAAGEELKVGDRIMWPTPTAASAIGATSPGTPCCAPAGRATAGLLRWPCGAVSPSTST